MKSPISNAKSQLWIWGLVVLLIVAHQDNWLWNNDWLVFGILPIGLFYHACLSIVASACWLLATRVAWSAEVEESAEVASAQPASAQGGDSE